MPLLPFLPVFPTPLVLLRSSSTSDAKRLESAGAPRLASSTNNASSALSETRGQSRRSRCSSARQCPSRQYRAITASEGSKSPEKSARRHSSDGCACAASRHARHTDATAGTTGTLEPATSAARFTTSRSASGGRSAHAARVDLKCASACAFNRLRRSARLSSGSRFNDDDDMGDVSVARPPPRRGLRGVRARPDVGAGVVHAVREVRDRGGAGGRDGAAAHRAGGRTGRAHTPTDDLCLVRRRECSFLSDVGPEEKLRRRVRLATPERTPREV